MRPASTALKAFLNSRQPWWSADLFQFELADGQSLYYSSTDQPITVGSQVYQCASATAFGLTRKNWAVKNTMDVPSMEIELISNGTDFTDGQNIKLLIHNGYLDGAWIYLSRAFMPVINGEFGNTSLGTVPLFAGPVGQVEITGIGAKITVRGANVRHQQYMPRNRFLLQCIHAFCDAGCKLNASTYTYSGTVTSANTVVVNWATDPTGGNYSYLLSGYITMTSGAANGSQRTIGAVNSASVALTYPFYLAPSAGDTFTVTNGCNKTQGSTPGANCTTYGNTQNFRAFLFVPPADQAT